MEQNKKCNKCGGQVIFNPKKNLFTCLLCGTISFPEKFPNEFANNESKDLFSFFQEKMRVK